jgi:hypothetical protein
MYKTAAAVKAVNPNQSTDKEFWINTVHLDGMTNINAGVLFLGSPLKSSCNISC